MRGERERESDGSSGSSSEIGERPARLLGDDEHETDADVARLLRAAMDDVPLAATPELISRTLTRVRGLILFGDVLRFASFEAFWRKRAPRRADAKSDKGRHTD